MSFYDSFMSDTVGVVYRAGTGNVDPWTKAEIVDNATQDMVTAGADPTDAATAADSTVTAALKTFSLGGDDPTGADPSQTTGLRLPSTAALGAAFKSLTNDSGAGCGITNLGGCIPEIPSWVKIAAGVAIVGAVLWVLRPYIGLAESVVS